MSYEAFVMKKKRMPAEATISILKQGNIGINRKEEEFGESGLEVQPETGCHPSGYRRKAGRRKAGKTAVDVTSPAW